MNPATRQDVLNIVEMSRSRIFERVATKQDVAVLTDTIRQLANLCQQSQQLLKQSEYQRLQLSRRAVAVEARMSTLENEVRTLNAALSRMVGRMVDQKSPQVVVPTPTAQQQADYGQTPSQQYVFRPN